MKEKKLELILFHPLSKQWSRNLVLLHCKIFKQWNGIYIPFRSIPFI